MSDKYDEEIERLKDKTPEELYEIWNEYTSPLFHFLTRERIYGSCGCPSQLVHRCVVEDPYKLYDALKGLGLPNPGVEMRLDASELPKFAAAQRLADARIADRVAP